MARVDSQPRCSGCSTTSTETCRRSRPSSTTRRPRASTAGSSAATTRCSAAGPRRRSRCCASCPTRRGSAATASAGPRIPATRRTTRSCRARSASAAAILGPRDVADLATLPESAAIGEVTRAWHGSPVSDVRSFLPEPQADDAELLAGVTEHRLVFGHTHLPVPALRRPAGRRARQPRQRRHAVRREPARVMGRSSTTTAPCSTAACATTTPRRPAASARSPARTAGARSSRSGSSARSSSCASRGSARTSGRTSAAGRSAMSSWRAGSVDRLGRHVLVRDQREQVADAVQPRAALVVGVDDVPGRLLDVRVAEHLVLGAGVLDPALARLEVHRAELPAAHRIGDARLEAALLLLVADGEPVLDEDDPGAHEHALELRARAHELLVLRVGAEAHDALDAGAVVPAAVEHHHLAGGGQVRDVALEVPLRLLDLGRRAEGDRPRTSAGSGAR